MEFFNEKILKRASIKFMINGYNREKQKLIIVFLIKYIWVFWYTAPKDDNLYQKKIRKARPKL